MVNSALTALAQRETGRQVIVDLVEWETHGGEWIRVISATGPVRSAGISHAEMLAHDKSICHLRRTTLERLLAEGSG